MARWVGEVRREEGVGEEEEERVDHRGRRTSRRGRREEGEGKGGRWVGGRG